MPKRAAGADAGVTSAHLRFLTFRIDERLYALRADDITEVVDVPVMARVPQAPAGLLGVASLRGSILPFASLRELLGLGKQAVRSTSRAIVLDIGTPIALVVDAVDALVTIPAQRVETRQAELSEKPGERLAGAFETGAERRIAKIVDIKSMLQTAFARLAQPERQARRKIKTAELASVEATAEKAEMLVTFEVAGQEFALDLDAVQEIFPLPSALTGVPRSEELVIGITALRDTLLPLLSLRGLLGFPTTSPSKAREKVLVMNVGNAQVGLVADRARAIVSAKPQLVDPIPAVLAARTGGEARIKAVYRGDGGRRLISILAPEQLFREDVMKRLSASRDQQAPAQPGAAPSARADLKVLVFRLGDDEFGLPIDAVDEVTQVPAKLTHLPKTPKFLEGVINLRGDVLPVVDQRRRFDMPAPEHAVRRRLIVVKTERHRAGLIVDSVSDVLRAHSDAVEPAPELTEETARLVRGVINLSASGRLVLLLDPIELLTRTERGLLDAFQTETSRDKA